MSTINRLFQKQPVEIPKRSGFDLSHLNVGTMKVGTLVPVLCEPVYPNDKLSCGIAANIQLPPMATDFIGKVDLRLESFFCPNRIIWHGWQKFYNRFNVDQYSTPVERLPKLYLGNASGDESYFAPTSLADYLGIKVSNNFSVSGNPVVINNPLPFLAYHMIYDRWYRDKVIQRPLFASKDEIDNMIANSSSPLYGADIARYYPAMMPYLYGGEGINSEYLCDVQHLWEDPSDHSQGYRAMADVVAVDYLFADGSCLFDLRQRNWAKDYFTTATPQPQAGDPISLEFSATPNSGGNLEFSIAALRAANALQKFAERRNIAGSEYQSQIHADWGIIPSDAILQHPIYLGGQTINVYNRSVLQSANGYPISADGSSNTRNPFASTVGASFGKSQGLGNGNLFNNFHATEHGFIMVIASLVPHAFYGTGNRKYLNYHEFGDFPVPALAGIGDQEIKSFEVEQDLNNLFETGTFGYTNRFAEAKFHNDEVHGLLRDGSSLQHFTIQRGFTNVSGTPLSISSDFIKIPTTAMDNVSAVNADISEYGAWYEMGIKLHKSAVLPVYSIPTLGDEKHTKTVMVDKGGKRL